MHFFSTTTYGDTTRTTTGTTSTESVGDDDSLEIEESIDEMLEKISKKLFEAKMSESEDCAGKFPAAATDEKGDREGPPLIDLTASDDENGGSASHTVIF